MTDIRKPVQRPDSETQDAMRRMIHAHLMDATARGSRAAGCTGMSFVMIGMTIWAGELAELDPRSLSKMLDALSVIYDPAANATQKARAEKRRRAAVDKLFAALDLEMNETQGNA
ncbi:hypothetical protein SAMN06265173_13542 [Thalassovita litoralis]|uniref:Uncharacterized protein n=1 Tax=Thalassovita litoralis TaxID=1010611 RepID=A0A521FNT0_9RHOB|nr:hypothetical protein [Thalassovita litoralis]SMO97220.1 hypothetical protein SAMN06265173_13542 [Thalassovita litoralis]